MRARRIVGAVALRFWPKVNKTGPVHPTLGTPCWLWTAATHKGYGRFRVDGKTVRAHRLAYELTYGPIPDNAKILHNCDNPPCCNPAHLRSGTQLENLREMRSKGRYVPWNKGLTGLVYRKRRHAA